MISAHFAHLHQRSLKTTFVQLKSALLLEDASQLTKQQVVKAVEISQLKSPIVIPITHSLNVRVPAQPLSHLINSASPIHPKTSVVGHVVFGMATLMSIPKLRVSKIPMVIGKTIVQVLKMAAKKQLVKWITRLLKLP